MSKLEQNNNENEYQDISLFSHPISTLKTLSIIILDQILVLLKLIKKHKIIVFMFLTYLISNMFLYNYSPVFHKINSIVYFCLYWILLGVASSIGLGTGLHTFVLYLGPHIAKATLAASECTYFPEWNPNKWEFQDFNPCTSPATEDDGTSFWKILLNVQLEAFLWGLGTAIGELPPYFMAKAAAESGKSNEEIEELKEINDKKEGTTLIEKAKLFIYSHLRRHGFITVLLCASIPNPLFDLAGITCGHFSIPFSTFFGATFIGKAIIKVHLQSIFVITAFSKHHVDKILAFFERNFPFLKDTLTKNLQKQKELLWHKDSNELLDKSKPLIATIWEIFITFMIVYFLISIINSVVNDRLRREKNKKVSDKQN